MAKISDVLARARREIANSGVSSSGLDSSILLAHTLSFSKEQILFNPDFELSAKQEDDFVKAVARRVNREPVSHIINKREFFGADFFVNSDVLDPRPDSEILIEAVLQKFSNKNPNIKILEVGVGSGCLIITLLGLYSQAMGVGLDISKKALEVCSINAKNHKIEKHLDLRNSDVFSALKTSEKFDLIISNPPYIPSADILELEPEVRMYEPLSALDGGVDGLDFYRKIAHDAKIFLKENGEVFLEIGYGQKEKICEIFTQKNFTLITAKPDLSGVIRVLQFKRK